MEVELTSTGGGTRGGGGDGDGDATLMSFHIMSCHVWHVSSNTQVTHIDILFYSIRFDSKSGAGVPPGIKNPEASCAWVREVNAYYVRSREPVCVCLDLVLTYTILVLVLFC